MVWEIMVFQDFKNKKVEQAGLISKTLFNLDYAFYIFPPYETW